MKDLAPNSQQLGFERCPGKLGKPIFYPLDPRTDRES